MKNIKKNDISPIKTFEYYTNGNNVDSIVEMARIGKKEVSFPYDVFVYGGDSYNQGGRNEHGEPHFHFSDNIKGGGKFSFSILIPTTSEWLRNKDLIISESINGKNEWKNYKKQKNMLIEWLDKPNNLFDNISNLQYIRGQWNTLNADNKNVKQIPMK